MAALEDSTLDTGRLLRGRAYARKGMVGPVTVAPGKVKAAVQGSRPRPYRSSVHLPVLTDPQWDALLDTIAARAGHLAALLDDEMPAELVDDARHAGVPLLPLPTEHLARQVVHARGSVHSHDFRREAVPLDFSQGMPQSLNPANTDSLGGQIQRTFKAKVGKTLNTMNAQVMAEPSRVASEHNVFVSGDDADAKKTVSELLVSFGRPPPASSTSATSPPPAVPSCCGRSGCACGAR